jgi:putative ABC transport system substrate-binding protein
VFSCLLGAAAGAESPAARIGILVSSKIRPYLEAAEGAAVAFEEAADVSLTTHLLDKYPEDDLPELSRLLSAENTDLVLAIGPGAARFAWSPAAGIHSRRLYAMVLNPERVIDTGKEACGISLNIPVEEQLRAIRSGLPGVRRLGLLFDPSGNSPLFTAAAAAADRLGMSLIAMEVSGKPDIPAVLEAYWDRVDALWFVPDRTVVSESIVEYVIRESIFNKVPVIGYNRFFYDSGASLAFVIDYREVGAQCAREAVRLMSGGGCRQMPPEFHLWVNTRVIGKLGVAGPKSFAGHLREGP